MFNRKCSLIGMVHLLPLPGAARFSLSIDEIMGHALNDAFTYKENGFDALLLENMHDVPYLRGRVEPETTAAMSVISRVIKYETQMPVGVQVLAGANIDALAVALAAGLDFIRVEGYVFAHIGDEGLHESSAAHLIRRRAQLHAQTIKIFADIKKKHSSHALTSDINLVETARAAEFFCADGVIVTGSVTGEAPAVRDVESVQAGVNLPVLVGSGVDAGNVHSFVSHADALIIGSSVKVNADWRNPVDADRAANFVNQFRKAERLAYV